MYVYFLLKLSTYSCQQMVPYCLQWIPSGLSSFGISFIVKVEWRCTLGDFHFQQLYIPLRNDTTFPSPSSDLAQSQRLQYDLILSLEDPKDENWKIVVKQYRDHPTALVSCPVNWDLLLTTIEFTELESPIWKSVLKCSACHCHCDCNYY